MDLPRFDILPIFEGYTVDLRLKEFRKITDGSMFEWEFIEFDSPKGKELLAKLVTFAEYIYHRYG